MSMKKRILIFFTILVLIVLLGPRLFVLSMAVWEYYDTEIICTGMDPTPPPGLGEQVPIGVYEVLPYIVLTGRGYMYPGDEYEVGGEVWYGMATLLFAGNDGATFVVTYRQIDSVKGYSRSNCKWFIPVGDYR
jgi:hypothetical protein